MKFTLPSLLAAALLAGLLYEPTPAFGQSKEILALQRDVYDLSRKLDEVKAGQLARSEQMETLLKEMMTANAALTAELKALQETVRRSQTDQQTRVIEPLSAVKVGMDDVSSSIAGVQANVTSMRNQQEETRKLVDDIWSAVKIVLKQTEQAPVPVSAAPSPADSAALMFAAAQRDKLTGKADFALQTLFDLSQKYPDSPEAPMAVYEMGELYAANGEYDQALKAFDRVLEQFGDNPMRKDAQFRKAEQLASLGRKADAVKEFNGFAKQFPGDDKAAEALSRVRTLNAPAPAPAKARPKARAK